MLPEVTVDLPVLFGRCEPPSEFVVLAAEVMLRGKPL